MTQKIIIAGAGIGGLAAASCLMTAGYDVEIYEQAPALTEVGAGIQMSANAMHVMNHLGLGPVLAENAVRPGAYVFRLYDTGEEISRFALLDDHERLHGAPYYQLHRADLLNFLVAKARELKPDVIHLNKTITGFEEDDDGVTLLMADGTTARGDILGSNPLCAPRSRAGRPMPNIPETPPGGSRFRSRNCRRISLSP